MIMIGCIYHEADLDGVMSAAIVKKYFKGDIDLLPYNYGKEIPDVNKYNNMFYEGLIMAVVGVMSMGASMFYMDKENMEDMENVYKFKKLSKMKLDDYGFGLFEYNGALYFKEADEGKCFDVRSGDEVIIGKDKIIMTLED